MLSAIATTITDARALLATTVPAFVEGASFTASPTHGLSIYFPSRLIHESYGATLFAQLNTSATTPKLKNNNWQTFLKEYFSRK